MNAYIAILLISLIVVYIVDLSGWTDTWKRWLGLWLGVKVGRVRPFDCSLCLTFWVGIVALVCAHSFGAGTLAWVCLCSYLTKPMALLLGSLRFALEMAINKLNRLWQNN